MVSFYLWADTGGAVHALTPERHHDLGMLSAPDSPQKHDQTRANGIDAAALLPKALWDLLANQPDGVTLMLDKSLPRAWHTLAWEQLNWRGQKLGVFLQLIRHTQPMTASINLAGDTLLWDQWPGEEFKAVFEQMGIERRFKLDQITQDIHSGRDLGHFSRLVITAHGGENEECLLLDKDGQPWDLSLPATLPFEVLILACASYHGNAHDLAVACLQRGAKAVICGHGQLNATLMAQFLTEWLAIPGEPFAKLTQLQAQPQAEAGSVHWLRYYGDTQLSDYDRRTLAFFQNPKKPNPFTEVSKLLDDKKEVAETFLQDMKNSATSYWPLTQCWLLSLAIYWAEKYQHQFMLRFKKQLEAVNGVCAGLLPEQAYGLANLHRRNGDYPLAVAHLAKGLQCQLNPQQEINLLGSLLNNLIDFNLPELGQVIIDRLDACLAQFDDDRQKFRLRDRRARLALRQGNADAALVHLQTKREQVLSSDKPDDIRELAGVLFVAAWFDTADVHDWANGALAALPTVPEFGSGNDDDAYLLRALAVWQWRQRPECDAVSAFLSCCKARLTEQDPGPYAYSLLCHRLATGVTDHWQMAVAGLEQGRYWLELAAFHALVGNQQEARRTLQKFQKMRSDALKNLAGQELFGMDWLTEAAKRDELENTVLLAGQVTANDLLKHGLLPL